MARNWQEIGKQFFGHEQFESDWALYEHAARLIIDRTFEVKVELADVQPKGIMSAQVREMLGDADAGAVEAAKHHLIWALAATAYVEDVKTFGSAALRAMLTETEVEW